MKHLLTLLSLTLLTTATAQSSALYRAIIVAEDGTFLGTCEGKYAQTSIANEYGPYGSKYSSTSMFNPYGSFGGQYSSKSPFNPYSRAAPYILRYDAEMYKMFTNRSYRPSAQIAQAIRASRTSRVSKNDTLTGAIDPDLLRLTCGKF